jgi:formylglycine-generating enzyme required for sulfatase activity
MTSRPMKMPAKDDAERSPEAEEVFSQAKRPELGRYLLQVDRQTKGSYTTSNAAQSAALVIKAGHPVVQVSVYDTVENIHTIVEAPRSPAA